MRRWPPAGHILGSAWVEFEATEGCARQRVVFSGDLGAPYTPLLPASQAPMAADIVVLECPYVDHLHESRRDRRQRLQALREHAVGSRGTLLILAFGIGRMCTPPRLVRLVHRHADAKIKLAALPGRQHPGMEVVVP